MAKMYRSSQGKGIDLGALLLQNETVRAVGNMGVNARGDRIDNKGKSIDSRVQQKSVNITNKLDHKMSYLQKTVQAV